MQVVTGTLEQGFQMPSVRQLAGQLAVNQNTVLKVYNELCRDGILEVQRGNGTFVAAGSKPVRDRQAHKVVAQSLREAVTQAIQFGISEQEIHEMLNEQIKVINS